MKIYHSVFDFKPSKRTTVTIGTFDGVHIGHKKIIQNIVQSSTDSNTESVVLTFFPHPRMVLQDHSDIKLLNTIAEKINLLEQTGLQNLIIHPFDNAFSRLSAEDFVEKILVNQFNIQKIIIGHDHRFGKNRTADIDDLIRYGKQFDFEVEQISAQEINEVSVSSTKIRNALNEGNILLANEYLGYTYSFTGKVVHGKQLGRTIGFPTANIEIDESYKLIPKNGVYVVESSFNNKTIFGIMNIGLKPTIEGSQFSIEVHFIDSNEEVYNHNFTINALYSIRDEQKFNNIDELKLQIEKDKQFAISFIENQ